MKIVFVTLLSLLILSCSSEKHESDFDTKGYVYIKFRAVPDSLKLKQQSWIVRETKAAHEGLSAGDYENIGSSLRVIFHQSEELFGVWTEGLHKYDLATYRSFDIPVWELSDEELLIFNHLKSIK